MRRALWLLEYALLSMARRWKKYLALLLVYALVVGFFSSVVLFTNALRYEARYVLKDVPELWIQQLAGGRLQPVSVSLIDSLKNIRGVEQVHQRLWGYYYDSPTGAVFTVIGCEPDQIANYNLGFEDRFEISDSTAWCGTGFMELHYLDKGQSLNLIDHNGRLIDFTIAGSFKAATDLLTRDLIITSPGAARRLLGIDSGKVTDIALRVYNSSEVDNIAFKISRRFPSLRAVTREQIAVTYDALFSWRGGIFVYGALISILAFLILAWDRASGLSREERRELGILKGIGWQINDVLWIKFWEGTAISLTATFAGILAAYLHIFVFNALLLKPFFIGWSVLYPDYHLKVVFDAPSVLLIMTLAIFPYLAATIIPAWRGAITDPAEIMQNG